MATTDKQIISDFKEGRIAPVYLLMGEEDFYIDVVSDYIENNFIDPTLRDFDQTVLYGAEVEMRDVVTNVKRYPMMSAYHLVLVKEAQSINAKQWGALEEYLKKPSDRSVLVLCYRHKKLAKNTTVYKAIAKVGVVYETPKIYDNQVPRWITSEVTAHGYNISPKAAALIVESTGVELSKIANELEKLYPLLKAGETINEQLVEEQIGISKDFNVFELQNAIGRRDVVMCNRIVNHMAEATKQNPLQPVLALLYGYFLKIMFYHQLENKSDAPSALGIPPMFVAEYAVAARNYSLGKLASCIGYLHEADLRSKGVRNAGTTSDGELLKELVFKIIH